MMSGEIALKEEYSLPLGTVRSAFFFLRCYYFNHTDLGFFHLCQILK